MVMKSVHRECIEEENKYRWLESEKAGYDLGEGCVYRWVRDHWTGYLRARWVEHLQGKCFWVELSGSDFGLLTRAFHDRARTARHHSEQAQIRRREPGRHLLGDRPETSPSTRSPKSSRRST
jgi:hypothetical protein